MFLIFFRDSKADAKRVLHGYICLRTQLRGSRLSVLVCACEVWNASGKSWQEGDKKELWRWWRWRERKEGVQI